MHLFSIAPMPDAQGKEAGWRVAIDGCTDRLYSSQWAAIVGAFVAARDATRGGDEAAIVMETTRRQVWTFSLMPPVAGNLQRASLPAVSAPVEPATAA